MTVAMTHILTIGHSNLQADQFLTLLKQHAINALVDIRRFPGSKKFPHFNQTNLATVLQDADIEYHWLEGLGGRRQSKQKESPNLGLENASFRSYADHMQTHEFRQAIEKLLELAAGKQTAIMCAESVFWRCHRRLVSDYLTANGVTVQHIMPGGELRPHKLTEGSKVEAGTVTYPGEGSSLF